MDPRKFNKKITQEAQRRLYNKSKIGPNAVNDKVLQMEKKVVNRYSRHVLKLGLVFAALMPPYVLYWKDKQMEVSFRKLIVLETRRWCKG